MIGKKFGWPEVQQLCGQGPLCRHFSGADARKRVPPRGERGGPPPGRARLRPGRCPQGSSERVKKQCGCIGKGDKSEFACSGTDTQFSTTLWTCLKHHVRAAATKRGPPKTATLFRAPLWRFPAADAPKRVPPRGERGGRGALPRDHRLGGAAFSRAINLDMWRGRVPFLHGGQGTAAQPEGGGGGEPTLQYRQTWQEHIMMSTANCHQ